MTVEDAIKEANDVLGDHFGACKEYVDYISERIPELRKVKGFYHCPIWGERHHWWLVDGDGKIIDPTADQFPSKGNFEYEEFDPEIHKVPIGRCLNCGELIFENKAGDQACDDKCYSAIVCSLL